MSVLSEGQAVNQLPIPAEAFGLLAIVAFAVLLGVTFAFKSVHTRHQASPRSGGSGH